MFQESLDMPMNQADNGDAERRPIAGRRGLALDRYGCEKRNQ